MTDKQCYLAIQALGLSVWKRDGEWRIDFRRDDPRRTADTSYFTTDRDDALATAKHFAEWKGGRYDSLPR